MFLLLMRLKFPLYFALFKWFLFEWRTWTGSRHLPDALFQSLCYFPPHWLQKQHTIYSYWFQSCPTSTDFLHYQRNNIIKTQIFQLFPNLNIFSDFQEKTGFLAWHQFLFWMDICLPLSSVLDASPLDWQFTSLATSYTPQCFCKGYHLCCTVAPHFH